MKLPKLTLIAFAVTLPLCLLPFIILFTKSFFSEYEIIKVFFNSSTWQAASNTLIISLGCTFFSLLIAVPVSLLLTRTDFPGKKVWKSLFVIPFAIPPYVGAIAWIILANPSNGLINKFLGFDFLNIYSYLGLIWVEGTFLYPLVMIGLIQSLENMDPGLEEAARVAGASPFRVMRTITLPLMLPSIFSGALLVFLGTAASFGVPALIGNPAGIYMLTTKIYMFQRMGSMSGLYQASALSFVLLIAAVIILLINQYLLKNSGQALVSGKTPRHSLWRLGRYKLPTYIFVVIVYLVLFGMPLAGILFSSLSKVQGIFSFENLGVQNFVNVFWEISETKTAFKNSFIFASIAATLAVAWGLLMAFSSLEVVKGKWRTFKVLNTLMTSLPYATPGTVLALGLILMLSGKFLGPLFYGSSLIIIIAYLSKYLNFSYRTCLDGLSQIDKTLAEAARVAGANTPQVVRRIWVPLLMPAMGASWFLTFMPSFSELTMTVLLTSPGLETIGTLIFQLQEYGDASGGGAAVLAILLVLFVLIFNTLVKLISKGKYGL